MTNVLHRIVGPMSPLFAVQRELNDLLDDALALSPSTVFDRALGVPPVDLAEVDGKFTLQLDVPGWRREDLTISVTRDGVEITGEQATPAEGSAESAPAGLRQRKAFRRSVSFPRAVDTATVEAKLSDGVLTITAAQAPEVLPRRIEVQVQ